MKFKILYTDPPWQYNIPRATKAQGGAIASYDTMSIDDLCNLAPLVNDIADDNCALFLWATEPKLPEALKLISAWGFRYVTCPFVWIKLNPCAKSTRFIDTKDDIYSGMGSYVNGNIEQVLLGIHGSMQRIDYDVKQVVFAPREEHSKKPEIVRKRIERVFSPKLPKLELFARCIAQGWTCVGNEIDGKNIDESLKELALKNDTL